MCSEVIDVKIRRWIKINIKQVGLYIYTTSWNLSGNYNMVQYDNYITKHIRKCYPLKTLNSKSWQMYGGRLVKRHDQHKSKR